MKWIFFNVLLKRESERLNDEKLEVKHLNTSIEAIIV